jgi:hypothetical protein
MKSLNCACFISENFRCFRQASFESDVELFGTSFVEGDGENCYQQIEQIMMKALKFGCKFLI